MQLVSFFCIITLPGATAFQRGYQPDKAYRTGGEILGIPLLDHIILGQGEYMSFKEEGYMQSEWKGHQEIIQAAEKEWKERSR